MTDITNGELVAVRIGDRHAFAGTLFELWDRGAAVLPLNPAAPIAVEAQTLARFRPARLIADDGETAFAKPASVPIGTALVMPTSGSTGLPKGVVLSHSAVEFAAKAGSARLGATSADGWLCCLPFHHIGGLMPLVRARLLGGSATISQSFDTGSFGHNSHATLTALVPTMLERLLDADVDLSSFRAILLGGGPIGEDLVKRAEARGGRIVRTYGMTETCGGCVYDGHALDGVEIKINQEQRILIRGPLLMTGYHLDPEQTGNSIKSGWLYTADRGEVTPDGNLSIDGRLDEIVISGGENVSLTEVEDLLRAHPAIKDAAALGLPDPEWGQAVVAAVVLTPGSSVPSLEELRDHIAAAAERFKAPKHIVAVTELPRTDTGTIDRAHLSTLF